MTSNPSPANSEFKSVYLFVRFLFHSLRCYFFSQHCRWSLLPLTQTSLNKNPYLTRLVQLEAIMKSINSVPSTFSARRPTPPLSLYPAPFNVLFLCVGSADNSKIHDIFGVISNRTVEINCSLMNSQRDEL